MTEDDLRPLVTSDDADVGSGSDDSRYGTFDDRRHRGGAGPHVIPDPEAGVVVIRPLDKVSQFRQTLSSFGFCMGAFAMGNMLGWSSTALPQLESPDSSLHVDSDQAGWIGALICLGALLQGPFTGIFIGRFGRRGTMLLMSVPLFIGWLLIVNAQDVAMLYIGRLVTGFAAGSYSVIAPIYVGEIASPAIRGGLGTLFQIMVVVGIFAMFSLGTVVSWKTLAIICSCVPWMVVAFVYFLKDSPTSYMLRGRPDLARKALIWLRNTADIDDELSAVQTSVDEARRRSVRVTNILCNSDPTIRKPLLIAIFLMVNQQLSGINAVIAFTVSIFHSSGSSLNPNVATIIIGGVHVVATIASSFVVNRIGRRPTLLWTQGIMTASLIAFGTFFYLKEHHPDAAVAMEFIPITSLIVFSIAFSFGLGPLAWLMLGELLPPKVAGVAASVAAMVNWAMAFTVTVTFNYLLEGLGDYGTYWLYATFCVIGMGVTWSKVPETRGKSLREIQELFRR